MKTRACIVLASLLFASPAFADGPVESPAQPAQKDKPAAAPTKDETVYTTGFQLQYGSTVSYLGGQVLQSVDFGALLVNLEVMAGGYVSDHFGLFGGIRGAFGKATAGCDGCGAVGFRVPLRAEYAIRDRLHGLYVDAGLTALNYTYFGDKGGGVLMNDIVDLEGVVGYRMQNTRNNSLDLHLGVSGGSYTHAADVDVPSGARAVHYEVAFGFGYAWAP